MRCGGMATGERELARELANKCREHDQLAAEARARANGAAFDGHNRSLLNRWKVRGPSAPTQSRAPSPACLCPTQTPLP